MSRRDKIPNNNEDTLMEGNAKLIRKKSGGDTSLCTDSYRGQIEEKDKMIAALIQITEVSYSCSMYHFVELRTIYGFIFR